MCQVHRSVVEGADCRALFRVAELRNEYWGAELHGGDSTTQNDLAADEHAETG